MTPDCCDHCGAELEPKRAAFYFVGNVLRHSCKSEECCDRSRAEMRRGAIVSARRAA